MLHLGDKKKQQQQKTNRKKQKKTNKQKKKQKQTNKKKQQQQNNKKQQNNNNKNKTTKNIAKCIFHSIYIYTLVHTLFVNTIFKIYFRPHLLPGNLINLATVVTKKTV